MGPIPESEVEAALNIAGLNSKVDIAAFYNLYAGGNYFRPIVDAQVAMIQSTGLLDRLDKVFYATMGPQGADFDIEGEKYVHLAHYGDVGEEVQTLSYLFRFCNAHPSSKVLYFHDKGSLHDSYSNRKFCSLLNCYVLNTHCISALDSHDTCGWRISPTPKVPMQETGPFTPFPVRFTPLTFSPLPPRCTTAAISGGPAATT
jgi:hypothetical protein